MEIKTCFSYVYFINSSHSITSPDAILFHATCLISLSTLTFKSSLRSTNAVLAVIRSWRWLPVILLTPGRKMNLAFCASVLGTLLLARFESHKCATGVTKNGDSFIPMKVRKQSTNGHQKFKRKKILNIIPKWKAKDRMHLTFLWIISRNTKRVAASILHWMCIKY